MKVSELVEKYFSGMPTGKASNTKIHGPNFYSFSTIIATIQYRKKMVYITNQRYSATTSKVVNMIKHQAEIESFKVVPVSSDKLFEIAWNQRR